MPQKPVNMISKVCMPGLYLSCKKKFTSLKLILSELEPDQDLDSSMKFQISDFY